MVENRVNFKLRYMLPGSDERFDQKVKEAVEKRQKFDSRVEQELLTRIDVEDNG